MRSSPASQPRQQQCELHREQLIHELLLAAHNSPPGCLQEQCVSKAMSSIALPVSCPFTPSRWQRPSRGMEQQGSTALPSTPPGAAAGGPSLSAPPNMPSLLPQVTHSQRRSPSKVTLAPLPGRSAGSFSPQQQLLGEQSTFPQREGE